jgi:hypothetical protein
VGNQYTAAASCDGVGACPAQVTTTCAGGFVCGATTCKTSCAADSDCAAVGDYCLNPGASGTCVARRSAGAVCTANNQCAGGNCAGGVCCSSACNGTCQACTLAFTGQPDGTCASVLPGHLPADPNQCVAAAPCGKTGVCAAGGSCQVVAAGVAVANPVAGDCHSDFCNGAGQTTVNGVDDTDVPVDGNACTLDVCTQGAPTNPPAPAGTSCSVGGNTVCNGAGACGACVPGDSRYCCGVKTSACCLGPGSPNEGKAVSTPGLTCCCGTAQDCDPSGQWGACY